jgi:hypothetical protein
MQVRGSWLGMLVGIVALATVTPTAHSADKPLPGIVFVGGPVVDGEHEGYPGAFHWRDGYVYPKGATNNAWERTHAAARPGRNLFALVPATPDGTLTQLTFLKEGNVFDPEPSFDGKKVLFSMRRDGEDWYHLYEVGVDGSGLTQLTDGAWNDVSGVYLPDGRIVFCSDRAGYLDEYHEERSEFLHRMNADGSGIEQITFTPGNYFEPTVLKNGLILCSFWDAFHISVPPFIKHETYLVTLRPDGTEERHLFGAGQYKFYNRTRHASVGLTRAGEMPDGRILVQSEMGPSLYDPDLGQDLATALAPVFPGTASVQTGGTTHMIHLSPLGTRASTYPLLDGRFLMAATLPGSRDLALYTVDPTTRQQTLLFDRPDLSEWDAVPVLVSKGVPRVLPDTPSNEQTQRGVATYVVVAGRDSDTPERNELNKRARFVRVLQAEPTELAVSSHTSLETRVLGVVPLLADGSVAFEGPADTPLFLETLDAAGKRLVLQAGYMSARAGEVKSCYGCHASQSSAVANAPLEALKRPLTRITRDSTDLSYRRNDPDEYRRQAAWGTSDLPRGWLASSDPEIIRRGLEILAWQTDEVTNADRARFVELLTHAEPAVRRQAAFGLAMIGTVDAVPALVKSLDDADWQTAHFANMGLEAMSGEALEQPRSSSEWKEWWREAGSVDSLVSRVLGRAVDSSRERDAWLETVVRLAWRGDVDKVRTAVDSRVLEWVRSSPPSLEVVRAAGWLKLADALPSITPWLVGGANPRAEEPIPDADDALEREVRGMALAREAALATGRIGTEAAVEVLWQTLAKTVPVRNPAPSRHYQTGPRPEEYTYLRALLIAGGTPTVEHVPTLIALLPSTFGEKPRFEDRTKPLESQRATLARKLLGRSDLLPRVLEMARAVLRGDANSNDPLYVALLKGSNNDRPYSEHGHPFDVLTKLHPEQALQYLACLATSPADAPEALVSPFLASQNHRERIEAAVVLRRVGWSRPETATLLVEQIRQPYPFREIWSIGKGRFDLNFRDKAYLLMALAAHTPDVSTLHEFTHEKNRFRDIRLGLALGLGMRGAADPASLELLSLLEHDPIFSVRRTARNSLGLLADAEVFGGRKALTVPPITPFAPAKPEIAAWTFMDRTPDVAPPATENEPGDNAFVTALATAIDAKGYANVANTFARNAERMRLTDARVLERAVLARAKSARELTDAERAGLAAAIGSPYPFAHYLAARFASERHDAAIAKQIHAQLGPWIDAADTVGVHWGAEAIGRSGLTEGRAALVEIANRPAFTKVYGSPGMAYGYAATRGLGLLDGMTNSATVDETLATSDNPWLRAGYLEGLALSRHPSARVLLERMLAEAPGAFLEDEARFSLGRLESR